MQELKIEEEDEITGMKGIFCKRDHFVQFLYPGWKLMYKTTKWEKEKEKEKEK